MPCGEALSGSDRSCRSPEPARHRGGDGPRWLPLRAVTAFGVFESMAAEWPTRTQIRRSSSSSGARRV